MKLLLVEDDSLIAICTQDVLTSEGYEVLTASTAQEGLDLVAQHGPDLACLISDVRLTGSISGWEIARSARAALPGIAVVYTTTADTTGYASNGVGRSVLLQKPYTIDRVVEAVAVAMSKMAAAAI